MFYGIQGYCADLPNIAQSDLCYEKTAIQYFKITCALIFLLYMAVFSQEVNPKCKEWIKKMKVKIMLYNDQVVPVTINAVEIEIPPVQSVDWSSEFIR